MSNVSYKEDFFALHQANSTSSANHVIPVILSYIQPDSVVDIGCGIGTWLAVWKQKGVTVLGVDGDYVKKEQLLVSPEEFISHDLGHPFSAGKKFDLVTSLEVGEHIQPASARVFVDTLCNLGDVILFTAAIPGQGGTYHVNEQYPDYWASLFEVQGFVAIDCIRKQIWNNKNISWWYRQNILFFVKKEALSHYAALEKQYQPDSSVMQLVHPELLESKTKQLEYFKKNLHNPVRAAGYYLKKIIGR
jgi:SAM-dependent methyltransferase